MKEKINQFAKGIFEYEMPSVVLEPGELQLSVDAGASCEGRFLLSNQKRRVMKGIVCTDCHYLVLEDAFFQGPENEIRFTFQGTYLMPGEVVKGNIRIVSDCGNVLLPFCATVCIPSCTTSAGKIKDLSHFAGLAKEHMQEAVKIFSSPRFESVFLGQDARLKTIYRGLIRSSDKGLAMEEFLISSNKKVPIRLSVEKRRLHFTECREAFRFSLPIKKDTWGYGEYKVLADAEFVEPDRQHVRTTDFVGDVFELGLVFRPDKMAGGRNFARLTISDAHQTVEIEITADREDYNEPRWKQRIQEQQGALCLFRNFLEFRCGKITPGEYCIAVERVVCNMDKVSGEGGRYDWVKRVFQIHLGIVSRLEESVSMQLSQLEEQIEELIRKNPLLYCAYYYLMAQWKPEEGVVSGAAQKVRECYQAGENHWLILWFLLELDGENITVRKRQETVLEELQKGCHSPLMYLKLCELYNEEPELLLDLNPVKARCMHWGCRKGILNEELLLHYAGLIGRQKGFSDLFLEDLYAIYGQIPDDGVLTVICQMLMRGRRVSREDFKWYALAIEKNLKITDLYEHYMYALDESVDVKIPPRALLYFTYTNHLNTSKKALLYAYVIRNKESDRETYEAYCQIMQRFAGEQLGQGRISENLAVVYEEFINEEVLDETLAKKFPSVLFAREITCYHPDITAVAVLQPEIGREEVVPLVQGKAVVTVYTGGAEIFLLDADGNRYSESVDYTSNRLLHLDYLAGKCLEYTGDHAGLLLHLYEKADRMNQTDSDAVTLRGRVMGIPGLEGETKKKVFASLVRCYFDNFEGELLDYQLEHMDWQQVDAADRGKFVEYCAIRRCYGKGMEGILSFGYDRIDAKRLLQISADTFRQFQDREDARLVKLAWHIFRNGEFDENLLLYLCAYFKGGTPEMIQIWKAAGGFGLDVQDLSERILAQILFTEEMVQEGYDVFYGYCDTGLNKKLIRAFLKMQAYQYMVKGQEVPEKMFAYFYKDARLEENRPCLLASLRHMSRKNHLTGEETIFVDYNIHQLCEKNIVFGFYKDFYGKVSLTDRLVREQYIEYRADPHNIVKIQYRILCKDNTGEYITENMRDVFEGIRVKAVTLFRDEILQYRITETGRDGREKKTETRELLWEERTLEKGNGNWYHMLNQMMEYREKQDNTALLGTMQEYAEKRELVKRLMKPLGT